MVDTPSTEVMNMKLILVADPMCSWCYWFGKEVAELHQAVPELALQVVVGGLARLDYWLRAEAASGLTFDREAFITNENLAYDTEPACRAVVTARRLAPKVDQLAILRSIQHAFYDDERDITKSEVLADVTAGTLSKLGFATTPNEFLKVWQSAEAMAETRGDFLQARRWGISSFPSLLLEDGEELYSLAPGFMDAWQLASRIRVVTGSRIDATPRLGS
jgi:putative protein-disulfide isomerase